MPKQLTVARSQRTRQPTRALKPDWSNPLTAGLQFLMHGAYPTFNAVDGKRGVITGTANERRASRLGVSFKLPANASPQYVQFPGFTTSTTTDLSFLLVSDEIGSGGFQGVIGLGVSDGHSLNTYEIAGGPPSGFRMTKSNVANVPFTPETTYVNQAPHIVAVSYRHATGAYEYLARNLNTGELLRGTATNTSALAGNDGILILGSTAVYGSTFSYGLAAMWTRPLLLAELEELVLRNPWQLFERRSLVLSNAVPPYDYFSRYAPDNWQVAHNQR